MTRGHEGSCRPVCKEPSAVVRWNYVVLYHKYIIEVTPLRLTE